MKRTGPGAELQALRRYLTELEAHFLARHLVGGTLGPPKRAEILDVAAYVVLAHGAMENFIEGLALWVLGKLVSNWTTSRRATRCTASILLYQPEPDKNHAAAVYDNIREALVLANKSMSTAIQENNGIGPRHLRSLFHPLGVNVPDDPVLTGSLDMVVAMRHHWAHQYRYGATVTKSAQDARIAVGDCLEFAKRLSEAAASARP